MSSRLPPPPANLRPAGHVTKAFVSDTAPSFVRPQRRHGRRALGIRYEKAVQDYLEVRYGQSYIRSPWLHFANDKDVWHWCQPDGVLLQHERRRFTIIEVKYQHTSDAWWQVEKLYRPVLEFLFPGWECARCEVVKWFDGTIAFPEQTKLCEEIGAVPFGFFGVHIYKP